MRLALSVKHAPKAHRSFSCCSFVYICVLDICMFVLTYLFCCSAMLVAVFPLVMFRDLQYTACNCNPTGNACDAGDTLVTTAYTSCGWFNACAVDVSAAAAACVRDCSALVDTLVQTCSHHCAWNNGYCASCAPGYYGSQCQYQCPQLCNYRGTCAPSGTCVCNPGYSGNACQFPPTPGK
jgi:hypothetical protein